MKIPDKVRISGIDYRVEKLEHVHDGEHVLYGQIDYNERAIRLNYGSTRDHEFRSIIFLHEMLHGIIEDRGLELEADKEEEICEALSRGLYQVLQDNARKLFDLASSNSCSCACSEAQRHAIWRGGEESDDDDKDHSER